jgi:hypothetical protein
MKISQCTLLAHSISHITYTFHIIHIHFILHLTHVFLSASVFFTDGGRRWAWGHCEWAGEGRWRRRRRRRRRRRIYNRRYVSPGCEVKEILQSQFPIKVI